MTDEIRFVGEDLDQHWVFPGKGHDRVQKLDDGLRPTRGRQGCRQRREKAMQIAGEQEADLLIDVSDLSIHSCPVDAQLLGDVLNSRAFDAVAGKAARGPVEERIEAGRRWRRDPARQPRDASCRRGPVDRIRTRRRSTGSHAHT